MTEAKEVRGLQAATLGGGCFWFLEAVFERLRGVDKVVSGYAGGSVAEPTYQEVCSGTTGHAEVIQITFDPSVISYSEILDVFFAFHDPTTLNRQGPDIGTQYRSAIFFHSPEHKQTAEAKIAEWNAAGTFSGPIVTQVAALEDFHPAEEYHQGFYRNNPAQGYCQVMIAPKVAKLRQKYADRIVG